MLHTVTFKYTARELDSQITKAKLIQN